MIRQIELGENKEMTSLWLMVIGNKWPIEKNLVKSEWSFLENLILGDFKIQRLKSYWKKWGTVSQQEAIKTMFIFLKQNSMNKRANKDNMVLNHRIFY